MILLLTIILFKLISVISLNTKKKNFYLFFQSLLIITLLLSQVFNLEPFIWTMAQAQKNDYLSFLKIWIFLELFDLTDALLSSTNKFEEAKLLRSLYPLSFFFLPLGLFLFLPLVFLIVFLEKPREKTFFTVALLCLFGLQIFHYDQFLSLGYVGFFILYLIGFQPQISSLFLILLFPLSLVGPSFFNELDIVKFLTAALLIFFIGRSLFFNFNESAKASNLGIAALGIILTQLTRGYDEVFFISLFFLIATLLNRVILLELSEAKAKTLKEIFAENQLVWFLYSFYLLGNLGLPPALGFVTFSVLNVLTPFIPIVIFSLLFFLVIHFFFGLQRLKLIGALPQKDTLTKLPIKALLFGFLFVVTTAYYVQAFGFFKEDSSPAQITFSWWWISYLSLCLAFSFFTLTSDHFNFLWLERLLSYPDYKKSSHLLDHQNVFLSFKRQDSFSLKEILVRFPTQWAFFSWAISLALGLSLLFAVTYGS